MSSNGVEHRIVVVGPTTFAHGKAIAWNALTNTVLPDYDVVVLYLPMLEGLVPTIEFNKNLVHLPDQIRRVLSSKGQVVVIAGAPTIWAFNLGGNAPYRITWQGIIGHEVVPVAEQGTSFVHLSEQWKPYLRRLQSWQFHFSRGKVSATKLLVNREGLWLAATFVDGLTIVPVIPDMDPVECVCAALSATLGRPLTVATPAPAWAGGLALPGVDDLATQIDARRKEITAAESAIARLSKEQATLLTFRQLVYGTGSELHAIVNRTLERLGCIAGSAKYSNEDLVPVWRDTEYIAEVKGLTGDLGLGPIRQLLDWTLAAEEIGRRKFKGILFVNTHRLADPAKQSRNSYPPNVVERAQELKLSVVSTFDLFGWYCRVLSGELAAETVMEAIVSANGPAAIP